MRFKLTDLLWLTVVVALSLGWFLHYQRLTRPPKLYRDEEIMQLMRYNSRYVVDKSVDPPRLLIVPEGKSLPLSQVFKTLKIDPNRLTGFQHAQYNRGVSLSWQLSPSYVLYCATTDEDDETLAFDDPQRKIYAVSIHERENQ